VRLNRYLSLCGHGSRRGCEQIILDGRVMVNNKRCTDLATAITDDDHVTVDGKPTVMRAGIVLAFHKPRGYVCTRDDESGRQTIYDLLPAKYQNLHHVGRLDKESEGLLLLTNQGDLTHRLMHPSEGMEKEYEVRLETEFNKDHLVKLLNGVMTEEGYAKAERVWMQNPYVLHIILKQGLKRQIRLMLYVIGHEVERLTRTRIGGLLLKGLPRGGWKELTEHEVAHYFKKTETKPKKATKATTKVADDGDEHFAPRAKPAPAHRDDVRTRRKLPEKRRTAPSTYKPIEKKVKARGFEHEVPAEPAKPVREAPQADKPRYGSKPGFKGKPKYGSKSAGDGPVKDLPPFEDRPKTSRAASKQGKPSFASKSARPSTGKRSFTSRPSGKKPSGGKGGRSSRSR